MTHRLAVTLLGHKDHGKSTLIGRLLFDTKSVMADRVEDVRAASHALGKPFEYAFLLDSFQEEREDGMTIDVIHAQIKGTRRFYDCIDVPGHEELIKNMLTGASHADAGILIASAKEGIEEQTGQHVRLAHWLGLDQLIVAVNKMDLVGYEQRAFEEMKQDIAALVDGGLRDRISYIPISAYEGENVVTRSSRMNWYTGPTLFELMEALTRQSSLAELPLRLPVQGVYPGADGARIIGGRIESGSLRVGQSVCFVPSGAKATVTAIVTSAPAAAGASAGDNIGFVCDPSPSSIKRGEVVCSADALAGTRREIQSHAIFLESVPTRLAVECGTGHTAADVAPLSPAEIGEVGRIALRFAEPLVVERARTSLGRVALKHLGKIVGVAVVA